MDTDGFWAIVDASATPAELHARLDRLDDTELVDFERQHASLIARAYRWDLWGAAYVINGGCSDDSFECFRAYLILTGPRLSVHPV